MKFRSAFLIGLSLLLVACGKDPVSTSSTNNPSVPVSLLFTHKECNVYRFKDDGRYVYYTDCQGSTQAFSEEYCGKGCTQSVPIFAQTFRHP